jgi:phosphoribosyl-ATP pyrophosphohydrolase
MIEAIKSLSKEAEMIAHSLVLMTKRNAELQAANDALSKRRSYKGSEYSKKEP